MYIFHNCKYQFCACNPNLSKEAEAKADYKHFSHLALLVRALVFISPNI